MQRIALLLVIKCTVMCRKYAQNTPFITILKLPIAQKLKHTEKTDARFKISG